MPTSRKRSDTKKTKRPSTPFLILLNAVLFLGIWAFGANIFGQVLAVIFTVVYVAVCGIWHLGIILAERRYRFPPFVRTFLFLAPLLLILALPIIGINPPITANQQTPLISPSERYELQVRSHRYWDLRFRDLETSEAQVEETEFAGHFPIYWQWDDGDRLWVFNGEDWVIYFWENVEGEWVRSRYDQEEHAHLTPPDAIFPEYIQR